ncbi:hypothetical protein [Silvanigrella aquatica]|uniref:F-box domain-containing protein n=1 Tax=Silvanigrella aquatica TaxID=1915309 RepID=A0A1L4CX56_9BACT|nr:hypothetical protein [Silvanigrella aquatica]APJ02531.1 hypothetical protein AXG55_00710 [Silvanigrella aquatica]
MKYILICMLILILSFNKNTLHASDFNIEENSGFLNLPFELKIQIFNNLDYKELLAMAEINTSNKQDIVEYLSYIYKVKDNKRGVLINKKFGELSKSFILNLANYISGESITHIEGTTHNLLNEIPIYFSTFPAEKLKNVKSVKIIPDQAILLEIKQKNLKKNIENQRQFSQYIINNRPDLNRDRGLLQKADLEIYSIYKDLPVVKYFEDKVYLIDVLKEKFPTLENLYIEHENTNSIDHLISGFNNENYPLLTLRPLFRINAKYNYLYILKFYDTQFLDKIGQFKKLKKLTLMNMPKNVYLDFLKELDKLESLKIQGGNILLKNLKNLKSIQNIYLKISLDDNASFFFRQYLRKYEFSSFLNIYYKRKNNWNQIIDVDCLEHDFYRFESRLSF